MSEPQAPSVKLVVPVPEAARSSLNAWSWLLPPRIAPLAVNRFGDWYLLTPDGSMNLLSIWEGAFGPVAESQPAWQSWLATDDGMQANWVDLVVLLYDRGKRLAEGECFAFVPPPIGDVGIDIERVIVSSISAMTTAMGQTFEQLTRNAHD